MGTRVDQNTEPAVELQTRDTTDQQAERLTNFEQCVSLHKAALQGNWEEAERLRNINEHRSILDSAITEGGETALHLASAEGHVHFVKQLLTQMEDPLTKNAMDKTALCFAATSGHVQIAEAMWQHDQSLIHSDRSEPLFFAVWQGHKEMAYFLFHKSDFTSWNAQEQINLLNRSIRSGLYGLAVDILETNAGLAVIEDDEYGETPLQALAKKPSAFCGTSPQGFRCNTNTYCDAYKLLNSLWRQVIIRQSEDTTELGLGDRIKELLFTSAESKNDYFTIQLIRRYPDFIYKMNNVGHSIFHIAVLQRCTKVFSLTYELRGVKDIMIAAIDVDQNNILHLAAKLPPQNQLNTIQGAALQMQRELLWYKEVEKIVPPAYKNKKNAAGKTPHELFMEEHNMLMKEGEKQIKQIAKSCMLVTTLITTIVFTTVFTAPGGYNNQGIPILRNRQLFMILPISQAIATLASLISMLMFLSVLTSRYSQNDFLKALPLWLVVGVIALFLSIVAMMAAFCTCLFFYKPGLALMVLLLLLFASVPITFLILKSPLLLSIIRSTYSSKGLFRSNNQLFS